MHEKVCMYLDCMSDNSAVEDLNPATSHISSTPFSFSAELHTDVGVTYVYTRVPVSVASMYTTASKLGSLGIDCIFPVAGINQILISVCSRYSQSEKPGADLASSVREGPEASSV